MPKFAKEFTYRDPMVTVTYPAGWEGRLPMERYQAARAAGAFNETDDDEQDDAPPSETEQTGAEAETETE